MAINNREVAARNAEKSTRNVPDGCQLWTRTQFNAPSAGDQDHDGDADAVDGWKSEPVSARHHDRNAPRGVPVAWAGGSRGHGHRAISLGGGKIRTTDGAGRGVVATHDIDWPEREWGLTYLGWSETIDGFRIPVPPKTRGPLVDSAIGKLVKAQANTKSPRRRKVLTHSINALRKLKRYAKP
jgi:hypothetical protein